MEEFTENEDQCIGALVCKIFLLMLGNISAANWHD